MMSTPPSNLPVRRIRRPKTPEDYRGIVTIILSAGLALFLILFMVFQIIDAMSGRTGDNGAISENATQLLSTAVGGIIGVLAGYVGGINVERNKAGKYQLEEMMGLNQTTVTHTTAATPGHETPMVVSVDPPKKTQTPKKVTE